jgi:hypothetical protein
MTERAATAPTVATMDTSQGRRKRRRKRKTGMVGKGDCVTMSAKPDGGDGQLWTKKPCFAPVDDLNGQRSVLEKRNIEEALRLCDEADARTVLPIRVYIPATTEANDGKPAATAAVDDSFVHQLNMIMKLPAVSVGHHAHQHSEGMVNASERCPGSACARPTTDATKASNATVCSVAVATDVPSQIMAKSTTKEAATAVEMFDFNDRLTMFCLHTRPTKTKYGGQLHL